MREAAGLLWCVRWWRGWARGAAMRQGGSCFLLSCFVSLRWLAAQGATEEGAAAGRIGGRRRRWIWTAYESGCDGELLLLVLLNKGGTAREERGLFSVSLPVSGAVE